MFVCQVACAEITNTEMLNLRECHFLNSTMTVGGAIDLVVVAHNKLTVSREVYIELNEVALQLNGMLKGREGVLVTKQRASTMGNDLKGFGM